MTFEKYLIEVGVILATCLVFFLGGRLSVKGRTFSSILMFLLIGAGILGLATCFVLVRKGII